MLKQRHHALILGLMFILCPYLSHADTPPFLRHSLYVGITGGYGSTTWGGLVPKKENQNLAISMSAPILVREGGTVWGLWAGYELIPNFALEAEYTHFPHASISFDSMSLFSFNHEGKTSFSTDTESYSLMGKISILIPKTTIKLFSRAGAANVHRQDLIQKDWHLSPTFGIGLGYDLNQHLMGEVVGNYIAGYGESQLNPSDTYFPFLYSLALRLAYRF